MLVFSTRSYQYLQDELSRLPSFEAGVLTRKQFPDGETYYRIDSEVEHREVVVLGGTISDTDTLELFDLASGLVSLGVKKLHLVLPFYGYSTMERAVKKGEIVTAKTRAKLISAIPKAYYGNRVLMIDLHAAGIEQYFEGDVHTAHLYAKPLIIEAAREIGGEHFVLASTDAGRAKWVESLANDMGVEAAFVYKMRTSGSETHITGINANVQGKKVVIYDDMIRTGGSLVQAAKAYKQAGAAEINVIATHGLFPANAVQKLKDSGVIKSVTVTNTHPAANAFQGTFIRIKSIAPLLADFLASKNN
ncbi:MAG: ribose-phosphate pyrophosphokinase [Cytophagales bacterium]|nr:MAG: ribose-phosphate pyrophosphokinase [Cytophagales bacterium]TAF61497.1 MAG: ribose-phosphate pyrophosphokinase [Cytophagales bacterium]